MNQLELLSAILAELSELRRQTTLTLGEVLGEHEFDRRHPELLPAVPMVRVDGLTEAIAQLPTQEAYDYALERLRRSEAAIGALEGWVGRLTAHGDSIAAKVDDRLARLESDVDHVTVESRVLARQAPDTADRFGSIMARLDRLEHPTPTADQMEAVAERRRQAHLLSEAAHASADRPAVLEGSFFNSLGAHLEDDHGLPGLASVASLGQVATFAESLRSASPNSDHQATEAWRQTAFETAQRTEREASQAKRELGPVYTVVENAADPVRSMAEELAEYEAEDEAIAITPVEVPPDVLWGPRLQHWVRHKMWLPEWQGRPGQADCAVPEHILRQFGFGLR